MKKILLSIVAMSAALGAVAQVNPIEMYPHKPGDVVINKCYDAQGNLHATMRYTISDSREGSPVDDYLEIKFVMTDGNNEVIDYGTIFADYDGRDFRLSMSNRPETANIMNYISLNTKIMNDFLDYPDTFNEDPLLGSGPFQFDPAHYTIKTGEHNRDFVNVRVAERNLVGSEKVKTPAGEFDASKITFALDLYDHDTKHTDRYKGTEWYVANKGVVRTEITDTHGNLIDYSELAELDQ